jgi:hypothetical protein
MTLDLAQFQMGVEDALIEKHSAIIESGVNENILPFLAGQKKWKYVLTPEGLRLSDGDRVYGFALPDPALAEMKEIAKLDDVGLHEFEKDKLTGGTAQIHRASPDNIYLTLADGTLNPTFTLEHSNGKNWKYLPSKKLIERKRADQAAQAIPQVNPEALLEGAADQIKAAAFGPELDLNQANDLVQRGLGFGKNVINGLGSYPALVTLGGLLAGKKISDLRKATNPEYLQEVQMNPGKRFNREIALPLLGGAAIAGGAHLLKGAI